MMPADASRFITTTLTLLQALGYSLGRAKTRFVISGRKDKRATERKAQKDARGDQDMEPLISGQTLASVSDGVMKDLIRQLDMEYRKNQFLFHRSSFAVDAIHDSGHLRGPSV